MRPRQTIAGVPFKERAIIHPSEQSHSAGLKESEYILPTPAKTLEHMVVIRVLIGDGRRNRLIRITQVDGRKVNTITLDDYEYQALVRYLSPKKKTPA
jgi:hypothetical protein